MDASVPPVLEVLFKPQQLEKSAAGSAGQVVLGSSAVMTDGWRYL